jgi:hypothetical protein
MVSAALNREGGGVELVPPRSFLSLGLIALMIHDEHQSDKFHLE